MSVADEIEKLKNLHAVGALTDEEFARAKADVMDAERRAGSRADVGAGERREAAGPIVDHTWPILCHVSFFAFGFAPVIIWLLRRGEDPAVDAHGKIVVNWLVSLVVYWIAAVVLCATGILAIFGVPMIIALSCVTTIFPIVGAVKAAGGVAWRYPGSINVLN